MDKMKHNDRVLALWDSLGRVSLNSFISHSHGVVMPFLLVPSEIPLAIVEAMSWGKPVITTRLGGTGEFVAPFGCALRVGDTRALARAMIHLAEDMNLYNAKRRAAIEKYRVHPTWHEVSLLWLDAARSALRA